MTHKKVALIFALSILFLSALTACGSSTTPTPTPSPSPSPSPTPSSAPPPASTWRDDQIGVTWGDTPSVIDWEFDGHWRTDERVNLARQADAPWTWDRWSVFWFWVEQPHRPDPWGPGRYNFEGTLDAVHPDDPGKVAQFNVQDPATANPNTLIVLDGIARPYDCNAKTEDGSNCYGSDERIQGLFEDILLADNSVNPDNHWADYVYHTVSYFDDFGIHYYQAYNEPDAAYWSGGTDPAGEAWADDYAQLVAVTLGAAQKADPQAKILLAAPTNRGDQYLSGSWIDRAFRHIENRQLQEDIEAIAIHSYQFPVLTQEYYQRIKDTHPDLAALPVWITESGVTLCTDRPGTNPCANDEEEQASYVIQQFAYALTIDAERVFHHRLADDCEADFGLYANDEAHGSGSTRTCNPTGDYVPRAALATTEVIADYLQGGRFIESREEADHVQLVFEQPDQKVTVLWATTERDAEVEIPISEATRTYWVDQAGNWGEIIGQSSFRQTLPGATATPQDGLRIGGYTYLLIETTEPADSRAPQGGAELVCENGQLVGTRLWGYDEDSGLDEFSYHASPEKTYDLSWTQPGIVYGGVFREVPPVGGSATLTLTNEAGLSIVQTLFHPEDICKDDGSGGSSAGGDHPDDNHSAASPPIPAGEFFALPEGARVPPRVAILNRGSSHGLWHKVLQLGETAISIGSDFDPVATAQTYPVLLIPSGGLYGLENSPSFRAANQRVSESASRPAVTLYLYTVTLYAGGTPVYSSFIVHLIIVHCPPCSACVSA